MGSPLQHQLSLAGLAVELLRQTESPHDREPLFGAAVGAAPAGAPKDFHLTQPDDRHDDSGHQRARHEYEVHQWNGKSDRSGDHTEAEYRPCAFEAVGRGEDIELHASSRCFGTECSQGQLQQSDFHVILGYELLAIGYWLLVPRNDEPAGEIADGRRSQRIQRFSSGYFLR